MSEFKALTKKQIMNASYRQLDIWVAQYVMGRGEIGKTLIIYVPHYSERIADAWFVVKRIREIDKFWCPDIFWDDHDGLDDGDWCCSFDYYGRKQSDYRHVSVNNKYVEVAICKAALLLVFGYDNK